MSKLFSPQNVQGLGVLSIFVIKIYIYILFPLYGYQVFLALPASNSCTSILKACKKLFCWLGIITLHTFHSIPLSYVYVLGRKSVIIVFFLVFNHVFNSINVSLSFIFSLNYFFFSLSSPSLFLIIIHIIIFSQILFTLHIIYISFHKFYLFLLNFPSLTPFTIERESPFLKNIF